MVRSRTFGSRHAPPIVTYGVAPKRLQVAEPPREGGRTVSWNIAGVVTPVAAITLGAMAFATTSDIPAAPSARPEASQGGIVRVPATVTLVEWPASRSRIPAASVLAMSSVDKAPPLASPADAAARVAEPRAAKPGPKPAAPNHIRVAIVAHPEAGGLGTQARVIPESGTRTFEAAFASMPKLSNPATKNRGDDMEGDFAGANISVPVEPRQPQRVEFHLATSPAPNVRSSSDTIRRDYSRTLAVSGGSRDVAISGYPAPEARLATRATAPETPAIGTLRDRMAAVRKASLPQAAINEGTSGDHHDVAQGQSDVFSAKVAQGDVTFDNGELSAVKISALLDVVKADLDPDTYEAFAKSSHANSFVSAQTLRDAGIDANADSGTGKVSLSSRN